MKVLILYPLWTGDYEGISGYFAKKSGGTYIPYNLALLAAITEKSGHEAKIIDGELEIICLKVRHLNWVIYILDIQIYLFFDLEDPFRE